MLSPLNYGGLLPSTLFKEEFVSHIVQIRTQVRDATALHAACSRLGLAAPVEATFKLFTASASGHAVNLPGWRYPIVCNTATGEVQFDNYKGNWGEQAQLDHFLQAYAVEVTKIEARKKGHTVTEQPLIDGSIKLTVVVNGGAT
jgi:hypothetical protein